MGREAFNLKAAAEHVHVDMNTLKHAAQRGNSVAGVQLLAKLSSALDLSIY